MKFVRKMGAQLTVAVCLLTLSAALASKASAKPIPAERVILLAGEGVTDGSIVRLDPAQYDVVVVVASWCKASHEEVERLAKRQKRGDKILVVANRDDFEVGLSKAVGAGYLSAKQASDVKAQWPSRVLAFGEQLLSYGLPIYVVSPEGPLATNRFPTRFTCTSQRCRPDDVWLF